MRAGCKQVVASPIHHLLRKQSVFGHDRSHLSGGFFIHYPPPLLPRPAWEAGGALSLIRLNKVVLSEGGPARQLELGASSVLIDCSCLGFSPVSGDVQGIRDEVCVCRGAPWGQAAAPTLTTSITTITTTTTTTSSSHLRRTSLFQGLTQ